MDFQHDPGQPLKSEYIEYFHQYIRSAIEEGDVAEALERQIADLRVMVESSTPEELRTVHDPYTWTITQALGHLVDSERVFGTRASRFASGDDTPLPGYDQVIMGNGGGYERCTPEDVFSEFEYLRRANILMFARFNEQQWQRTGSAEDQDISVRAIAYLLVGHVRYHYEIFTKRLAV